MHGVSLAAYIAFALSLSFFLGSYNETKKHENGWAFLWLLCLIILTIKITGAFSD